MAQKAEKSSPVLGRHSSPKYRAGQQHRQHRFQYVAEDNHKGQPAAEGPVEVRQPRVAAAVVPYIVPEDILGHNHRAVEAAQKIGRYGRSAIDQEHRQPQVLHT